MSDAAALVEEAIGEDAFDGDAHTFLMAVYKNKALELPIRVDAAKAAIRYEKPALSTVEAKVDATVKQHEDALDALE